MCPRCADLEIKKIEEEKFVKAKKAAHKKAEALKAARRAEEVIEAKEYAALKKRASKAPTKRVRICTRTGMVL